MDDREENGEQKYKWRAHSFIKIIYFSASLEAECHQRY